MSTFRYSKTLVISSMTVWMVASFAFAADPGQTGFSFLKVSPGARNAGMGDIGTALSSNLYGNYYNPAATAKVKSSYVGFMHHENIFDTRREFLGAVTPFVGGAFSVGFDYFKIGSIESRLEPTAEPIGVFDAQDVLFYAGYARTISQNLAVGATGKYAAERISSETAGTILFDVGAQYHPVETVTIGVAGRNFGKNPRFKLESIDMPVTIAGGIAMEVKGITSGVEVSKPKDAKLRVGLGAERYVVDYLALRAGYKFGYDEENLAFGLGFVKSIWQIDYAFVPYKSGLGTSHRFSLTVQLK